jgi:MFS family permease
MQKRHKVVFLSFLAVFVCYIDRVNISVAIIPMVDTYGWDIGYQTWILTSFYVGYLMLQIVGGRLADRYGGKVVLATGVLLWSLFTIFTPPAAAFGFAALLTVRVLMGMGEAVTFPSIYSLYARWVPLTERARSVAFANSGIPLGTVFALLVTPIIVTKMGWEWAFYLFGAVGVFWYALWHFLVARNPSLQPGITADELAIISDGTAGEEAVAPPPWGKLLSNMPVWAIIVAHFCNNWSLYVLLSWLPTYVNKGLGVDYASVGYYAMIPHIASFFFLNIAGNIGDRLIKSGMSITRVRKLMQTIGFGGIATSLLLVTEVDSAIAAIGIMAVGSALGAFVTGGFSVNHMDIAPQHAGTLMGLTNTAGTIPGIIGVGVSGAILAATGSWALVFQVAAGVTLFGLVFFLLFASGERQFD